MQKVVTAMLNVAAIMGRLTNDPELRHTPNGVAVTAFTLAVDRNYAPQGQERQTDFIDVVAWRGTAEFVCKYFSKGRMMGVDGSIQVRNYEDKNGNKRKAVEIVASNVSFAGDKPKDDQRQGGYAQPAQAYGGSYASAPTPQQPAYPASQSYGKNDFQQEDMEEMLGDDLPF